MHGLSLNNLVIHFSQVTCARFNFLASGVNPSCSKEIVLKFLAHRHA